MVYKYTFNSAHTAIVDDLTLTGSTKLSYADIYLFTKLYELSEVDQCGPE